ncbi:hypothetical protein FSST1_005104 [Fusarium sambucinum]
MADLPLRIGRPDQQPGHIVLGWKRIGWPSLIPVLERRPLHNQLPEDAHLISSQLKSKAMEVLLSYNLMTVDAYGFSEEQILIENRSSQGTLPGRPTLVLAIKWPDEKHNTRWRAAKEIAGYVRHITKTFTYTFYVEITSAELVNTVYCDGVRDWTLSRQWNDIQPHVAARLHSLKETRDHVTCLDFRKFGCDPDLIMNPPTVYIVVDDDCDERCWYVVVSAVKDILRKADVLGHVEVHIETNKDGPLSNSD